MFFIMGVSQENKELNYKQINVCKCCGKYSNLRAYVTYWYFMLFFIPIIKWNKKYYVKTDCCNRFCEIEEDIGKLIEKGNDISIDVDKLDFGLIEDKTKVCLECGYMTEEDFTYCPKCSNKF